MKFDYKKVLILFLKCGILFLKQRTCYGGNSNGIY